MKKIYSIPTEILNSDPTLKAASRFFSATIGIVIAFLFALAVVSLFLFEDAEVIAWVGL